MENIRQFETEQKQNWLKGVVALKCLQRPLESFIDAEVGNFHRKLVLECGAALCVNTCNFNSWKPRPNTVPTFDCDVCCRWRDSIHANHTSPRGKVMWLNSKPHLWSQEKWEVAKVYMPDGHKNHETLGDFDIAALLCLMNQCKHFKKFGLGGLCDKVSNARNQIMHAARYQLEGKHVQDYFGRIQQLGEVLAKHDPEFKKLSEDINEIQNLDCKLVLPADKAAQELQAQAEKELNEREVEDILFSVLALRTVFSRLGFTVEVHNNLTAEQIRLEVQQLASRSFLDEDALVVCMLSHGEIGSIFGTDERQVYLHELMQPFMQASTLERKPKLFFIQSGRVSVYNTPNYPRSVQVVEESDGHFDAEKAHRKSVLTRVIDRKNFPGVLKVIALFIPCCTHSLDLLLCDAVASNRVCLPFFGTLQRLHTIFSASVKRWDILKEFVDISLKPLSNTRWEAKIDSAKTVGFQLEGILDALEKLEEVENDVTVSEAVSLSGEIVTMEFLMCLLIWCDLLSEITFVSNKMQAVNISKDTAIRMMDSLKEFFLKYKKEGFQKNLHIACEIATDMDATPEFTKRRVRKRSGDDSSTGHFEQDPETHFRCMVFNVIVETVIQELSNRFCNLQLSE